MSDPQTSSDRPIRVLVAKAGLEEAKNRQHDIVIIDTAGRLGVDQELMQQASDIRAATNPDEVLFGQRAVEAEVADAAYPEVYAARCNAQVEPTTLLEDDGTTDQRLLDRRRYDPLENTSGFLQQVLARLTIHLSIGEAY